MHGKVGRLRNSIVKATKEGLEGDAVLLSRRIGLQYKSQSYLTAQPQSVVLRKSFLCTICVRILTLLWCDTVANSSKRGMCMMLMLHVQSDGMILRITSESALSKLESSFGLALIVFF